MTSSKDFGKDANSGRGTRPKNPRWGNLRDSLESPVASALGNLIGAASGFCVELAFILSVLFFATRLAPGGPFDEGNQISKAALAQLETAFGLQGSLLDQYFLFIENLLFGLPIESFSHQGQSVRTLLGEAIPVSLALGTIAFIMAQTLALCLAASHYFLNCTSSQPTPQNSGNQRQRRLSHHIRPLASTCLEFAEAALLSLPSFVVAGILIWLFAQKLNWLPSALWVSPASAILPALALAARPTATLTLVLQMNQQNLAHQLFLQTARAKGLSEGAIWLKHFLPASAGPWLAQSAIVASQLLTGSFVIESVFQIPGLGRLLVRSVLNRDYPLTLGTAFVYSVCLISIHRISDLLQSWMDPRIVGEQESSQ